MPSGSVNVGPKRALQIAGQLGVSSVAELDEAVRSGRLRGVAGFGPKSEERILRGIGVAVSDAALRTALRSLPADATQDDIYAVLAAQVSREPGAGAPQAQRGREAEDAASVREEDLIRVANLRGDLHTQDRKSVV